MNCPVCGAEMRLMTEIFLGPRVRNETWNCQAHGDVYHTEPPDDELIICPACGSTNVVCIADDDTLAVYTDCLDCGGSFINTDDCDDDDICNADDGIIDDEDAAYAPPADSRSEDARD